MVFHNPWGLLALLSLPLILGLHFFHSRRKVMRIGGLHLWQFAQIRLPVGRKFDRITRNLSLLFQLLAALLLSLLLGGFDIPLKNTSRHYTVMVDDSISMQAGQKESSHARAVATIKEVGKRDDHFTLIAAGKRPEIVAGPFADRNELLTALKNWTPNASSCDLEASVNLSSKFLLGEDKLLFVTDDEAPTKAYEGLMAVAAVGKPYENIAIDYADRARVSAKKDRVFVTLQNYAKFEQTVTLRAMMKEQEAFRKAIDLAPSKPVTLKFDINNITDTLTLAIGDDALAADNTAILPPVAIKTVHIALNNLNALDPKFIKAIQSSAYVDIVEDPFLADLVFTTNRDYSASPANYRIYQIPSRASVQATTDTILAVGQDIIADHQHAITESLPLEGVLWPGANITLPYGSKALLAYRGIPLLWGERLFEDHIRYHLNLFLDRTNIFTQNTWPILIHNIIEECRGVIPGLEKTNFRLDEPIRLNINTLNQEAKYQLLRNGEVRQEYDVFPEVLASLPIGEYTIRQLGGPELATFGVNLFAPGESDLRTHASNEPTLSSLIPSSVAQTERNKALYYLILLFLIGFTAASWIFQDMSR